MAIFFPQKERYSVQDLIDILVCLRSPEGCPWDREQTHQSIRSDFLEETYEAIEAINNADAAALQEELGDVLLQIVFHTQIAREQGQFDFDDVVNGICQKLIVRHPHVFGDVQAERSEQVLKNWDAIKRQSKADATQTALLKSVPRAMPALIRSAKVQNRARRVGVELSGDQQATDYLSDAYQTFVEAPSEQTYGKLLFALVCYGRRAGLDAELCLTQETDAFIDRFAQAENRMSQQGATWEQPTARQLEDVRDQAYFQ